jgi:hypothetical protein
MIVIEAEAATGKRRRRPQQRQRQPSMLVLLLQLLLVLFVSPSANTRRSTFFFVLKGCHGFSIVASSEPVSALLKKHADEIARLESVAKVDAEVGVGDLIDHSKVFYLRYCLDDSATTTTSAEEDNRQQSRDDELKASLAWRRGAGRRICDAARKAVLQATSEGEERWSNGAVLDAAPHASKIKPYLTPVQVLTTTLDSTGGDLIYCIRAGKIDDNQLLSTVTTDELVEFFLYVKEIHSLVANQRSLETDRLLRVVTANDLTNVPLVGGSAEFRQALSRSSKLASSLYPSNLSGPTLLLNLPKLLSALVKLFTPLFPPAVNARLKFANAPCLASVDTLLEISAGGPQRQAFVSEIEAILRQ